MTAYDREELRAFDRARRRAGLDNEPLDIHLLHQVIISEQQALSRQLDLLEEEAPGDKDWEAAIINRQLWTLRFIDRAEEYRELIYGDYDPDDG